MASQSASTPFAPSLPLVPDTFSVPNTSNMASVDATIESIKRSLGILEDEFDSLSTEASHVAMDDGQSETDRALSQLRKEMDLSDERQQAKTAEVKDFIQNELQQEVIDYLKTLIDKGVLDQIDEVVDKEVDAQFKAMRPETLQATLEQSRKELKRAEYVLLNGESRELNRKLSTNKMDEKLHELYTLDDVVSEAFPKTLGELFALDTETATRLLKEYGVRGVSENREDHVNRFMQFCGVGYQMSRTSSGEITINKFP